MQRFKAHVRNRRLVLDEPTDRAEGEVVSLVEPGAKAPDARALAPLQQELELSFREEASGAVIDLAEVPAELEALRGAEAIRAVATVHVKVASHVVQLLRMATPWWQKNYPGFLARFEHELPWAIQRLLWMSVDSPPGEVFGVVHHTTIRRVVMPWTELALYYSLDATVDTAVIRAIWGQGPSDIPEYTGYR